jgi:hypothetical protein
MKDTFARPVSSAEVACRDPDGRHLGPLLGDLNRRCVDDLLRPLAQVVARADLGLTTAPVAHAEGIIPVADAA